MRKPRDYDAELKALEEKARSLRVRKISQHGELVAATGADALDIDQLAGGLIALVELSDLRRKEQLRERDAAFFQRRTRKGSRGPAGDAGRGAAGGSDASSPERDAGAA